MKRRRKWWWFLAAVLLLPAGLCIVSNVSWFSPEVVVSPETTYVTEPLAEDGLPDLVAAFNRRFGQGVTPENNAAAVLLPLLRPENAEQDAFWRELLSRLGVFPPPENMSRLIVWDEFLLLEPEARKITAPDPGQRPWAHFLKKPWRTQDAPALARWLEENQQVLQRAAQAVQRPRYFVPLVRKPGYFLIESSNQYTPQLRQLGTLLALRATWHLGRGDLEAAWQSLETAAVLGARASHEGTLLGWLAAMAIYRDALTAAETLVKHASWDEPTARRFLRRLEQLPRPQTPWLRFTFGERLFLLDVFLQSARGRRLKLQEDQTKPLSLRNLDWNLALRIVNQAFDRFDAAMQLETYLQRDEKLDQLWLEYCQAAESWVPLVLSPFSRRMRSLWVTYQLLPLWISTAGGVNVSYTRMQQWHIVLRVALVLAAYRARHGRYPERLEELVPQWLAEVPPDLFSGRRLIYRREGDGYVLYSVEVDGRDHGGPPAEEDEESLAADLGIRFRPGRRLSRARLPLVAPAPANAP